MIKKLILVSITLCFSTMIFAAGLGDAYKTVEKKVKSSITGLDTDALKTQCPVYADTPFQDIERADLDLVFVVDLIDNPGDAQYHIAPLTNYHIQVNMNLSSSFFVYAWAGQRETIKAELEDAIYAATWKSQMAFVGVGLYLTPVFKIHFGGGKIWLEDANGAKPPLGAAIEGGFAYDIAWGANKIVLSWKLVESPLSEYAGSRPTGAELQGSGSYMSAGIGLSIPFMR